MTCEEAREFILANYFDADEDTKAFVDGDEEHWEMKYAVDALEKQIPKRPIDDTLYWAICPACGGSVSKNNVREYVVEGGTSYCEHCGQALDWGDTV